MLKAQESERKRLASELHDGLGHALLTIKIQLRFLEKQLAPEQLSLGEEMESIVEYMDKLINDVRRMYNALTPGDLKDFRLTLPRAAWSMNLWGYVKRSVGPCTWIISMIYTPSRPKP